MITKGTEGIEGISRQILFMRPFEQEFQVRIIEFSGLVYSVSTVPLVAPLRQPTTPSLAWHSTLSPQSHTPILSMDCYNPSLSI